MLKSPSLEVHVNPNGALTGLFFKKNDGSVCSLVPTDPAAAGFPMIPYSNRIADGKFSFLGTEYQLRNPLDHAIHGFFRNLTHKQSLTPPSDLILSCVHDPHGSDPSASSTDPQDWPWALEAQLSYKLIANELTSEILLSNIDTQPFPVGLGWHPYWNRSVAPQALPTSSEPVLFRLPFSHVYPDAHGTRIPSGPPEPRPAALNFDTHKPFPHTMFIDSCCVGWTGEGEIVWPESHVRVRYSCDDPVRALVLYNPPELGWFAVEPVSNATDGINRMDSDLLQGMQVLEPGQTLRAHWTITVEELNSAM